MNGEMGITAIPGVRVGHFTDAAALTGVTVVLVEGGAVAGVDVRGSAPGTRETDLLQPTNLVPRIQAVMLAGGSAPGLDAAAGVVRFLRERGIGYDTGVAKIPIVPAAILFDLAIGEVKHPDAEMGYQACLAASAGPVPQGNVGAGTGATVGKLLGIGQATKSGVGTWVEKWGDLLVGALAVVNAFGDVFDWQTGRMLAGLRNPEDGKLVPTMEYLRSMSLAAFREKMAQRRPDWAQGWGQNTTLAVVATNAPLGKTEITKVAQMAHDGLARAINPVHTMFDGDAVFALSVSDPRLLDQKPTRGGPASAGAGTDVSVVGALAAQVLSRAIVRAVETAVPAGGVPAACFGEEG